MKLISSLDEILDLFPESPRHVLMTGEIHTPCPFCKTGQIQTEHSGHTFYGEDRFIFFATGNGCYCRQCGYKGGFQGIIDLLSPGGIVSHDLTKATERVKVKKVEPPAIASPEYVADLHRAVRRDFWKAFGWTDETINRFQLGYGKIYRWSEKASRHIIPFISRTVGEGALGGYSFEGRLDKNSNSKEERNVKTRGLLKGHFWYIQDDPESNTVAIAEGLKDGITLWQMGYRNFVSIYGTNNWVEEIADFVVEAGYENIHIFGDNDDPGRQFNKDVAAAFQQRGHMVQALDWDSQMPNKFDTTNLLERLGQADAKQYIRERLRQVDYIVARGFITNYKLVDPSYEPAAPQGVPNVDTIREEMQTIPREFLDNYADRVKAYKRGALLVLAAPPGVGKSYLLVKEAERLALDHLEWHQAEMDSLREQIASLQSELAEVEEVADLIEIEGLLKRLSKRLEDTSKAHVLFASPFIDGWKDIQNQGYNPELWYNYLARQPYNEDTEEGNCRNYETVTELASKGYTAMGYCQSACPLRDWCAEKGYLSQDTQRKQKPITFIRHASLDTQMVQEYGAIIVDENPLNVFESATTVSARDLTPTHADWDEIMSEDQAQVIEKFVHAVRMAMNTNIGKDEVFSGIDFFRIVDEQANGELLSLLQEIMPDNIKHYQAPHGGRITTVSEARGLPRRAVEAVYRIMAEEAVDWAKGSTRWNSRIHLVDGSLELYELYPVSISRNKPMIIADGTAMPELYGYLFNRQIEVYRPDMYSPHAETTVWYGSDFTRSSARRQLGFYLDNVDRWLTQEGSKGVVYDLLGREFNLDDIPQDMKIKDSLLIDQALSLIRYVLADPRNTKILFVTYRSLRGVLESLIKKTFPQADQERLSFGHYGALRGTNRFKDHDAVLLLGCPRVSYSILHRKIQAWARLAGRQDYIRPEFGYKPMAYHGRIEGNSYVTFEDPLADAYVNMVEMGEVQQCLDRIRLHAAKRHKHAYLALARPAARWVTNLVNVRDVTRQSDNQVHTDAKNFVKTFYLYEGKLPSYNIVLAEYRLSRTTIKKLMDEIKEEMEIA